MSNKELCGSVDKIVAPSIIIDQTIINHNKTQKSEQICIKMNESPKAPILNDTAGQS